MTRKLIIFLAALALAADAHAKKPKNPRRAKRAKARAAKTVPAPAAPQELVDQLKPGRWTPEAKAAIDALVRAKGDANTSYDPLQPPVAVLPADGAAMSGDAGLALFSRLVEQVDFKIDDAFWQAVPVTYGRQMLKVYHQQFFPEPQSAWPRLPAYQQYRRGFHHAYRSMCQNVGRKECRSWLAQLLIGFGEEDIRAYAAAAVKSELDRAFEPEEIAVDGKPSAALRLARGIRRWPEIEDLVAYLRRSGFDVWMVGDSPQAAVEAAAGVHGIDPSRAAGIRTKAEKGKLTAEVLDPVPFRGGKIDAVVSSLGRVPALIIGADPWDIELLGYGEGLRVLLDKGDPALRALAEDSGWVVQPIFTHAP